MALSIAAGLARAKRQGKRLGRPRVQIPVERLSAVAGLPLTDAATQLGVSQSTVKRWRKRVAAVG